MSADSETTYGFRYFVSDEQLRAYSQASIEERLAWIEDMRQLTWHAATPETRASWKKLREHPPGTKAALETFRHRT